MPVPRLHGNLGWTDCANLHSMQSNVLLRTTAAHAGQARRHSNQGHVYRKRLRQAPHTTLRPRHENHHPPGLLSTSVVGRADASGAQLPCCWLFCERTFPSPVCTVCALRQHKQKQRARRAGSSTPTTAANKITRQPKRPLDTTRDAPGHYGSTLPGRRSHAAMHHGVHACSHCVTCGH